MSLKPIHKSYVELNEATGLYEIALNQDSSFRVTAYAQFANYTLVTWEKQADSETFAGQTLWNGDTPVFLSGGAIDLYSPEAIDPNAPRSEFESQQYQNSLQTSLYSYNSTPIPKKVAIALRDPKNLITLDLED